MIKTKAERKRLEEELRESLAAEMGVEPADIMDSSSLADDLGLSSLDMMELVMVFEDAHKVQIEDDKLDQIKTFGDLVTALGTS